MIKGAVPKGWHLKPPPRYGVESSSLIPHTQNRLIQVIYQCSLQKPPSQMLLGQQPTQRKRAWNANCVQTQSGGKGGHFRSAFAASRQKGGGVCRGTAPTGSNSLAFPVNRTKCQSILCCPVRNARLNKTVRFNINISHLTLTLLFLIVWLQRCTKGT